MKNTLEYLGIGFVFVFLMLGLMRVVDVAPKDQRPGLWLKGELVASPVSDWSFTDEVKEIYVQTNTRYFVPHSVTTYSAIYNDDFYLMSAYYGGGRFPDARSWNRNIVRDPRVRLKIGDRLFDQTVAYVDDPSVRAPVHQAFVAKYPEWTSPGLENVHMLLIGPTN